VTSLEGFLVKVLVEMAVSIDLSDDDDIDPDVAVGLFEPVAALLQEMSNADRRRLVELLAECAKNETDAERRAVALDIPNAFGLLE
jgi:hypothetical protein